MSVVEKLMKVRKERKWSQESLARELGVSAKTVHRWETGQFKPSPLAEEKIDRLLGR